MGARAVRIVMAEDSSADAELAARALKRHGIGGEIAVVSTEADFRQALDGARADLIISDNSMPQFSGAQALAIARELAPGVPFIFLSGSVPDRLPADSVLAQATACLDKRRLHELGALVETVLRA
jgi:CheY-like chemotaxis protein